MSLLDGLHGKRQNYSKLSKIEISWQHHLEAVISNSLTDVYSYLQYLTWININLENFSTNQIRIEDGSLVSLLSQNSLIMWDIEVYSVRFFHWVIKRYKYWHQDEKVPSMSDEHWYMQLQSFCILHLNLSLDLGQTEKLTARLHVCATDV